jgi:hypothetical protein
MALGEVLLEDTRIVFRNFAGKEGQYNREGDRNFAVVLDPETADEMQKDGWNVRRKPPKEEGDDEFIYLQVAVSFKGRPPRMAIITSRNRTILDEDTCELLDWAEIENVDVKLRPYEWRVNGKTGVKAYLKTIYVKIREDELDLKYEHLPLAGGTQRPELMPARTEDDFIDGEVVSEMYDEDGDAPKALSRGTS